MLTWESGGKGVPLVAIHGNVASRRWFDGMRQRPPAGFQVMAVDLPGFGDSAPRGRDKPTVGFFADEVEAWLRGVSAPRPVLLGHSLGGAVVAEMAARHPHAYRALVFISSCPLDGYRTPFLHYPVLRRYHTDTRLLARSLETLFADRPPQSTSELATDAQRAHAGMFAGSARALARWSAMDRLAALRSLPVLILGGEKDPLIVPSMVRQMARQLPQARLVMNPQVSHCWPLEAPDSLREELASFANTLLQ